LLTAYCLLPSSCSNEIAGYINTEVRKAYRAVNDAKIDQRKAEVSPLKAAHYPIDTIERQQSDFEKWCIRPIGNNAPDDAVGKEIIAAIKDFAAQWSETIGRWKQVAEIGESIKLVSALVAWCIEGLKQFDECMKVRSSNTQSWTNNMLMVMAGHIPQQSTDADVCLQVVEITEKVERLLEQFASKHNSRIPQHDKYANKCAELRKTAINKHPYLAIHRVLTMAGNLQQHGLPLYWRALRRFPKARASLLQQWQEREDWRFERNPWDREAEGRVARDPYAGQSISDAFDETEEYHPAAAYDMIAPNDPTLATRNAKSTKDSKLWTDVHKKHAGKIVFSSLPIDSNSPDESSFKSSFNGNDEIHARAYWPLAITQLALAKKRSDGSPVYGPEYLSRASDLHTLEIAQVVSINGVQAERVAQPGGIHTWEPFRGVNVDLKTYPKQLGQHTDFYAFNQSIRMSVSRKACADVSDDWETASNRYQLLLKQLPEGQHTVKIDLVYRMRMNWNNYDAIKKAFPPTTTPWSHPIASGEFTVTISPATPVSLGSMCPVRKTSVPAAKAAEYEALILNLLANSSGWGKRANKTEQPFYVALEGDWYCSGTRWYRRGNELIEEPSEYSIACLALFYRSPATGWRHEEIVGFHLSAITQTCDGCKPEPPFVAIAVGSNFTFDVDLLPDDVLAKINRCPEHLRHGVF
jgi:hypothetical protein